MNKFYESSSGRIWEWCPIWKCWQFEDYKYKIYPGEEGFTASYNSCWLQGIWETFDEAEKELIE